MAVIPKNRPVLGKDLDTLSQLYGLSTTDALFLFGVSITKWMHAVRRDAELPLADTSLALFVRFLDDHPEIYFMPQFPSPPEVYERIKSYQKEEDQLPPRHFSLIMGAESTASNRWLNGTSGHSPSVSRLLWSLDEALKRNVGESTMVPGGAGRGGKTANRELIADFIKTAQLEAQLRGVTDLFSEGRWPVFKQKDREIVRETKRSRHKKAAEEAAQKGIELTAKTVIKTAAKKAKAKAAA